jgi:hypothetical protein
MKTPETAVSKPVFKLITDRPNMRYRNPNPLDRLFGGQFNDVVLKAPSKEM